MTPSIVHKLRANLLLTSLAAAFVQICVLLSIFLLRVPEGVFLSSVFRLAALTIVACIVVAVHLLARAAFRAALDSGRVTVWGGPHGAVMLSSDCPKPLLVALHLRFNSRRFSFQSEAADGA